MSRKPSGRTARLVVAVRPDALRWLRGMAMVRKQSVAAYVRVALKAYCEEELRDHWLAMQIAGYSPRHAKGVLRKILNGERVPRMRGPRGRSKK